MFVCLFVCVGDDALPNGLDVTFEVTELRRLTGSYNTMVGNNEGSMVLGLKFPNLFGRAEKVTFQFSYGTKETSYGLSFFKPQPGNFERNFSVNLYKVTGQFPWSSLRETDRGISTEFNVSVAQVFVEHMLCLHLIQVTAGFSRYLVYFFND